MSGLFRMLNRILLWSNILRRVRGIGLRMQVGLLFSSLVDSLMILVKPALARLPMIYVQGIIYSPKYKAYFQVRRFSDDLYSIMPDREGDVNEKILECLTRGSLFVDVGANIGYYSVLAAKLVGNEGLVIAVEPNPETARILVSNIMLNGLSNVRILQEAAWDKKETIKLHVPWYFLGLSSARESNWSVAQVSVHAIPLDMILTGLRRQIDLVKIDAEGAELHVLKGLERTLKNTKNIILEASDNIQEITSLLKVKGFRIKKLKFTSYIYAYREDLITS